VVELAIVLQAVLRAGDGRILECPITCDRHLNCGEATRFENTETLAHRPIIVLNVLKKVCTASAEPPSGTPSAGACLPGCNGECNPKRGCAFGPLHPPFVASTIRLKSSKAADGSACGRFHWTAQRFLEISGAHRFMQSEGRSRSRVLEWMAPFTSWYCHPGCRGRPLSVEGLGVTHGQNILTADRPEQFVESVFDAQRIGEPEGVAECTGGGSAAVRCDPRTVEFELDPAVTGRPQKWPAGVTFPRSHPIRRTNILHLLPNREGRVM
jgi:hypothetical protein